MLSDNLPLRRETAVRGMEPSAIADEPPPLFVRSHLPTTAAVCIALYDAFREVVDSALPREAVGVPPSIDIIKV